VYFLRINKLDVLSKNADEPTGTTMQEEDENEGEDGFVVPPGLRALYKLLLGYTNEGRYNIALGLAQHALQVY